MSRPEAARRRIASTLNAAYADGLLSEDTFLTRLDHLFKAHLVDPRRFIGDLQFRTSGRGVRARLALAVSATAHRVATTLTGHAEEPPVLLALDWSGGQRELLVGRHHGCDVVLSDSTVSRRHAQLRFRDGSWVLQDLESTNGTVVNGARVGRCELCPGDLLALGDQRLEID